MISISRFSIAIATDVFNGVEIYQNNYNWDRNDDLYKFDRLTTETSSPNKINAVIISRAAWEMNPFVPFKHRLSLIITSNVNYKEENNIADSAVLVFQNLQSALTFCSREFIDRVFVAGDEALFNTCIYDFLTYIDNIYMTSVKRDANCRNKIDLMNALLLINSRSGVSIIEEDGRGDHRLFLVKMHAHMSPALLENINKYANFESIFSHYAEMDQDISRFADKRASVSSVNSDDTHHRKPKLCVDTHANSHSHTHSHTPHYMQPIQCSPKTDEPQDRNHCSRGNEPLSPARKPK
jgi:dihydrofolate reductase